MGCHFYAHKISLNEKLSSIIKNKMNSHRILLKLKFNELLNEDLFIKWLIDQYNSSFNNISEEDLKELGFMYDQYNNDDIIMFSMFFEEYIKPFILYGKINDSIDINHFVNLFDDTISYNIFQLNKIKDKSIITNIDPIHIIEINEDRKSPYVICLLEKLSIPWIRLMGDDFDLTIHNITEFDEHFNDEWKKQIKPEVHEQLQQIRELLINDDSIIITTN